MRKSLIAVGLLCLCLLLAGCGDKAPVEPDYSGMIVPPLQEDITAYLSAAQVEEVLGQPATLLGVFDDGTQMVYTTDAYRLTVNMQNTTRAGYEALLGDAPGFIPVAGLGEVAHRNETDTAYIAYAAGHTVEVTLEGEDLPAASARQLLEKILSRIAPTT